MDLAYKNFDSGNKKDALAAFIKARDIRPSNAEVHYTIGYLLGCPESIEHYKKAIELNYAFDGAFLNMGICYEKVNDVENALIAYKEALKIDPNNSKLQYKVGYILLYAGEHKKSLIYNAKALELQPNDYDAALNIGINHHKLKNNKLAIGAYKEAVKIKPEISRAYISLAALYFQMGNNDLGLKAIRRGNNQWGHQWGQSL